MLGFRKFLIAYKFRDKREGRSLKIFLRNFSSHSAEIFRWGTLYCDTDFWFRKILSLTGLSHDFSSIFFVSQCRKKS